MVDYGKIVSLLFYLTLYLPCMCACPCNSMCPSVFLILNARKWCKWFLSPNDIKVALKAILSPIYKFSISSPYFSTLASDIDKPMSAPFPSGISGISIFTRMLAVWYYKLNGSSSFRFTLTT